MNPVILSMNDILTQWKKDFDLFSAVSFEFSVDQGFVCFGNYPICKEDALQGLDYSNYDSESIDFFFDHNRSIVVSVAWPEDEPPAVSSIAYIQAM